LFLVLLLQAPAPAQRVVVGLTDGRQITVDNPEFAGFIQSRSRGTVLIYRQQNLHGLMPASNISRIEFGEYKKGKPFAMTVTLRDGQKVEVESERDDFITLRGRSELGPVLINHPDPVSAPLKVSTKSPDRKKDLTIQYLEFPAS
jgi:hypothetical protein